MYLIDTCLMIPLFKGKYGIQERVLQEGFEHCAVSELVVAELLTGAYKTGLKAEFDHIAFVRQRFPVLPVTTETLDTYARIRAALEKVGRGLDSFDLLIAATAVEHGMVLATNNVKHFSRIPGLAVENWIQTV